MRKIPIKLRKYRTKPKQNVSHHFSKSILGRPNCFFFLKTGSSKDIIYVNGSASTYRVAIYTYIHRVWSFPGGASGKEPTCQCRRPKRHGFYPWVGKSPWRRKWQPIPVFLPGKSHGQRSLGGYSPQGHEGSDMADRLSTHIHTMYITYMIIFTQSCIIYVIFRYCAKEQNRTSERNRTVNKKSSHWRERTFRHEAGKKPKMPWVSAPLSGIDKMCFRCSVQGFTALSWDWLKQNLLQLLMHGPFCGDQGG